MVERRSKPIAEFPVAEFPVAEFGERMPIAIHAVDAPREPYRGDWSGALDLLEEYLASP